MTKPMLLAALTAALLACALRGAAAPAQDAPGVDAEAMRCLEMRRGQPAGAMALARRLLDAGALPALTEMKIQVCLGYAAGLAGDVATARAAAARLQDLSRRDDIDPQDRLRVLSNLGAIRQLAGELQGALSAYLEAYASAEATDARAVQVATLVNIGSIHSEHLGAYALAEQYYAQAAALSDAGADHDRATLYYDRVVNLLRMQQPQRARRMLDEARRIAAEERNGLVAARLDAEAAGLLIGTPRQDEAAAALAEAIAVQRALPDPAGEAASLVLRARLERAQDDSAAALASAAAALAAIEGDPAPRERRDALRERLAALHALGRDEEALAASEDLARLQIDALRAFNLDNLALLQAQMQDAAATREALESRHQAELHALQAGRDRTLRDVALGALGLLLVAGLGVALVQRKATRRLRRLSNTDALTGLVNRRAATARLAAGTAAAPAHGDQRDVLMLIDVDHFKAINDRSGHAAGDAVLVALAGTLRQACRPDDLVARWGGEEFLVLARGLTPSGASAVAERLRLAAAAGADDGPRISVSIGFAPCPFFADGTRGGWQDAARIADVALYAAKRAGRDAWTGLWGVDPARGDVAGVLADPDRSAVAGAIEILGAQAPDWRPALAEPAPGSTPTLH
ncbi:GGDEF domain-containing protein [Coralloluteibacterium stylophorae]|uniref:diguanylate cyclase n=1 Tax=Coralloluteibacterium stylophorae TaxID=1776034 RepID=A0A8J8AYF2_9GAMM|nr:GGDEF domain-containing protein [Coralloluteibacterium stylophorae]MBS7455924.1 GGDEF domain-containing protein [Coralloluteibacterium stylophorae]